METARNHTLTTEVLISGRRLHNRRRRSVPSFIRRVGGARWSRSSAAAAQLTYLLTYWSYANSEVMYVYTWCSAALSVDHKLCDTRQRTTSEILVEHTAIPEITPLDSDAPIISNTIIKTTSLRCRRFGVLRVRSGMRVGIDDPASWTAGVCNWWPNHNTMNTSYSTAMSWLIDWLSRV